MLKNIFFLQIIGLLLITSNNTSAQSPGGVSGASLWYKSNVGVTNATGVSQWDDQSGNARHLTQSTTASRPVYNTSSNLINFNATVGFDGSNDVLSTGLINRTSLISGSDPYSSTTYIVYRAKSTSSVLYNHSDGSGGTWNIGGHSGSDVIPNRNSSFATPTINTIRLQSTQGITNGSVLTRINGTSANSTWAGSTVVGASASYNFWVGAQGTNNFGSNEIAELVSYPNNTNSSNERQRVESYLGLKYGITLPYNYMASDASVYWDATTNTSFSNNIFGLGRDDDSGLEQRQSQSINSGSQVIVSTGAVSASNASNSIAISGDKQFLVIGDNNQTGTVAFADSFGDSSVYSRLKRVWFADNTGSYNQDTRILIPTSLYGGANKPKLIMSSNNSFSATSSSTTNTYITAETATVTVNGLSYYEYKLTASQVTSDFYFTISSITAPGGVATGLRAWFKANDGVSSGAQWNDASINGNHVVQAAASRQPVLTQSATNGVYDFNFNPYFDFKPTNQTYFYKLTGIMGTNATAGSLYSTARSATATTGTWQTIAGFGDDNPNLSQATDNYQMWRSGGQIFSDIYNVQSLPAHGISMFWSAINGNNLSLNGKLIASGNASGDITDNTFVIGSEGYNVSAATGGNEHYFGGIPEVIVYNENHALNSVDRNKIESYMALKYGYTLNQTTAQNYVSSSGIVVWDATANATYKNNIAGIGKDAFSDLHQKQSKSVNSGNQIIMSTASLAATNATNTTDISANNQFLVWGDNNLTGFTTFSDTFGDASAFSRSSRVWFVDNTGSYAQDTRVLIPSAMFFGSTTPKIILSSTSTFSATASSTTNTYIAPQASKVTSGGVSYYEFIVSASQLANDFYMALANGIAPGGINTNMNLWVKADADLTPSSGTVTSWLDLTGTNTFSITGTPTANLTGANFNPSVGFNGSSLFVGNTSITHVDAFSVAKIVNATGASASGAVLGDKVSGAASYFFHTEGGNFYIRTAGTATGIASANSIPYTLMNADMSETGTQTIKLNGLSTNSPTDIPSYTSTPLIGSRQVSSTDNLLAGSEISEVILYDTSKAVDRQKIISYLALKYGITLNQNTAQNYIASDGTVFWNGTTNSSFKYNIAGVGRDDFSGVNQKQSQSVNTGNQIIVSNGAVATANATNANTITANKQFFMVGDNNMTGYVAFSDTFGDATIFSRSARIWYADNTGNYDKATRIYIPTKMYNGSGSPKLILSTTSTFSSTASSTTNTYISAEAATVTVSGATYFEYKLTAAQIATDFYFAISNGSSPGGIANARLWLRADVGTSSTTNGTTLSQWNDQSGNDNHVLQATAGSRPTYSTNAADVINFNPSVMFNTTNLMTDADGIFTTDVKTNMSVFAVNSNKTLTNGYIINGNSLNMNAAYGDGNVYWDGNARISSAWGGTLTIPNLWTGYNTSTANPNRREIRRNGQSLSSDATATSFTPATGAFNIGSGFNGPINEIIVYDINVAATDRAKVESYLAIKNGLTLSQSSAQNYVNSDGSTIWNATTNATYKQNIAGIGRDDLSALNQKQSKSVNSGSQVILSTGTIAATNTANANTITTNKQFLIWGDNGQTGYTVLADSFGDATVFSRSQRVWFAQNTGSYSQATSVYIPTALYNGTGNPKLILSSTSNFSSTASSTTNTYIAAEAATVTVNAVSYYEYKLTASQVATDFYFAIANGLTPGGVGNGLKIWHKADFGITATSSNVSAWKNVFDGKSATNNGSATATPKLVQGDSNSYNFNPYINLTLTSNNIGQLSSTADSGYFAPQGASSIHVFTTVFPPLVADSSIFSLNGNGASGASSYDDFDLVRNGVWNQQGGSYAVSGYTLSNKQSIYSLSVEETPSIAADNTKARQDLTTLATNTTTDFRVGGAGYVIGSDIATGGDNNSTIGKLGEIIAFSSVLSSTEELRVQSYLAIKTGVTLGTNASSSNYLDSNSNVIWTASANFQNNIAGIGRDDISALMQKQSKSMVVGNQIIMSTTAVATTNDNNLTSITANKQFLVWGDNNLSGTTTFSDSFGQSTIVKRTARVWFVDNTGSYAQATRIYIPVSLYNGVGTPMLIKSSSSTFSSTPTSTTNTYITGQNATVTVDGVSYFEYRLTAAQVANDFYFAIADLDSDSDGVSDALDIDDDNDGVVDTTEMSCTPTTLTKTGIQITSDLTYSFANGASSLQGLIDGNEAAQVTTPTGTFANATWLKFQLPSAKVLTKIEIGHAASQLLFTSGSTYKLQGSNDNTTWFDIVASQTYTNSTPVLATNNSAKLDMANNVTPYIFYRVMGISGSSAGGSAQEVYFTELKCNDLDSDSDTVVNRMDLDSDGDLCFDAKETGVTASKFNATTGVITGSIGVNGLADDLETTADTGFINYTATYSKAINALIISCDCNVAPATGTPTEYAKVGVSVLDVHTTSNWPTDIPNAHLVLESKTKGLVITRMADPETNIANPVEGMIVWDTDNNCLKLYNGTAWICTAKACNQ
ncbi:Protein of unknown function precursor; putative adhesin [Flavobacterium branchiophilum FL-15]|uniref:DUF8202 domain-containing protein n=3 Tax=Flavobacterium branchiophilum TaxID=55197 RepID=G2Z4L3_FLABF|nr:Protein of unknown function precursor; putative adhesin [Flavobacterium branchiophilum FL-15]